MTNRVAAACAAVFMAAALPAAAQTPADGPQYRDTLSRAEAGYFFGLYKDAISDMKDMQRRHPAPALPELQDGQCYTLVNGGTVTAIANSKYELRLSVFDALVRDADGQVLDYDGVPFVTHNYQTGKDDSVIASYDSPAMLRAAYGTAVAFPDYVAVGCYPTTAAAERVAGNLNAELERDFINQGFDKLMAAVERGKYKPPVYVPDAGP